MEIGPALIFLAVVLFAVGMLLRRVRPDKKAIVSGEAEKKPSSMFGGRSRTKVDDDEADHPAFETPKPPVAGLDVDGNVATVTFAVPVPVGGDDLSPDNWRPELRDQHAYCEKVVLVGSARVGHDRRRLPR